MSAYGYKRTFGWAVIYVRFTPESGHSHGSRKRSAYDPKRTFVGLRGSNGGRREKICFSYKWAILLRGNW